MSETKPLHHHKQKMGGRDPFEAHRVATPLELLFDLTFVVAFGLAASQFAHFLAEGHYRTALSGFGLAAVAICWAWINFSWFASAYDTDDWIYRLATMLQMIGVLVLALGLPQMFESIEHGSYLNNTIMVIGYVIMRVAMLFQWARASKQDPARKRACLTYAASISIAQGGWIILIFTGFSVGLSLALGGLLMLIEFAGPYIAEQKDGGTPWHAHHIAERYSLFTIIALGEGVVGTLAALSAVIESQGWTFDVVLVGLAGMGLTFGIWWVYFVLPSGEVIHHHRERSFGWGYGQIITVTAIVATGAGLHVAAYYIEGKAHIGPVATVLCVAIPVGIFIVALYSVYTYIIGVSDKFHIWLLTITAVVLVASVAAAAAGLNVPTCLLIVMLAPVVTVVGYETIGHKHHTEVLERGNEQH